MQTGMRLFFCFLAIVFVRSLTAAVDDSNWRGGSSADWFVNWDKALAEARKTDKALFLLNTGSDWCGWCKKMDEEVFAKESFVREVSKKFVLVMIDSPRDKSILSSLAGRQNQGLKATYSVRGFPTVVIVDPEGKEVKRHSGYRSGGPNGYLKYLRELTRGVKWPKKAKLGDFCVEEIQPEVAKEQGGRMVTPLSD